MASASALTPVQLHALFDILTHHETHAEISAFTSPDAVTNYGFPFARTTPPGLLVVADKSATTTPLGTAPNTPRTRTPVPPGDLNDENDDDGAPSESPLLQSLLRKLVLPLPGIRELPRAFWAVRMQGIMGRMALAQLSESYDKGAVGTRKTLATGASALVEMLGRGALGGVRRAREGEGVYDGGRAEDLERAWEDVVDGLVYGDMVDGMFNHLAKTDDLEGYSPAVKASAEYTIIHLATFCHHIFVLSPEGQYLLKLFENVHNLLPYKMIKQTLRLGNAATMINGMMRLLLAKLSVTSLTNWVGLTQNADDGMNLLQRIISLVLSWDSSEFKKGADKVEKSKEKPSDEALQAIRHYVNEGKAQYQAVRAASKANSQSIIASIFATTNPSLTKALTPTEHAQCLEYYSALLSVRDREAMTTVLCRQPPDLFTQSIKDTVSAYEPIIRTVHARIDLKEHFEATQGFVDDFIKASKPKKVADGKELRPASVEDYVQLFMKNRGLMYKWIHALASRCPDVWGDFKGWMKGAVERFKKEGGEAGKMGEGEATGLDMEQRLNDLINSLPETSQTPILTAIDSHAEYLSILTTQSRSRLQQLVTKSNSNTSTMAGPGVYLARWQNLLDATAITPATVDGPVRHGADVKNAVTMGKTGVESAKGGEDMEKAKEEVREVRAAPDVGVVVEALGGRFREIVQEIGARK